MPQWISPQTLLPRTCLPFLSCKTPGTNLDQDRCEQLPICSVDASRMVCFVLPSTGKLKVNWYIERHRIIPYLFYWFLLFTNVLLMTGLIAQTRQRSKLCQFCMGGFVQFLREFTISLSLLHVLSFWWLTVCQCLWSIRSSWETIDYGGLTMPGVESVFRWSSESFGWLLRPSFRF